MLTRFKEPVSGLTHLAGAIAALLAFKLLFDAGLEKAGDGRVTSYLIFGATLFLMYASSATYHLLRVSHRGELLLKRIDHIMIYMLIAGTYTPICVVGLTGAWRVSMLSMMWAIAITGVLFKIFWIHAPSIISTLGYLIMGWLGVIAIYPIMQRLSSEALWWIFGGGLSYTVGAIIYALKRPNPFPPRFGHHEIWHLFVLGGSFCHFWAIAYCM